MTSNGTTAGSAVVWGVYTSGATENGSGGRLRAYAATPTGGTLPLLWSAPIGLASKFSVPTAYEGRVYVGTRNCNLIAFGPSSAAALQAAPGEAGRGFVGLALLSLASFRPEDPLAAGEGEGDQPGDNGPLDPSRAGTTG